MSKFFHKNKRILLGGLAVFGLCLGFVLFFHLSSVKAATFEIDILAYIQSGFWSLIIWVGNFIRLIFGRLLLVMLKLVVTVGAYNNFINNNYVVTGWVILRDVCNMFFILGLLFIAFVTVLKIEKYQWNKFLARLLIMAILINFSKTVCGVIIDFFQVLMLTFVNSFQDIAEGTIFYGLGMADLSSTGPTTNRDMTADIGMLGAAATLLGAAFVVIACVTVLIFAIILTFRIVALWMLIVISPLAFFSYAFEEMGGKIGSISSRWWGQFLNYCMIGPFMAFFLWLSLTTMTAARNDKSAYFDESQMTKISAFSSCDGNTLCQADQMLGFLMGIIMLLGGLMMSGEFAVVGSSYATRFAGAVQSGAQRFAEGTVRKGAAVTAGVALYAPKRAGALTLAAGKGFGLAARDYVNRSKRLRYFTKEGQKEMEELVTSRFRRVGPGKLAVEQTRKEHQKKDEERLTTEGAFNDSDTWRSRMNEAKTKGDFREFRALTSRGAKEGWINTKDVRDFKDMNKQYGGVLKMNEREELAFSEELGKDYQAKTKRHIRTNDKYISPEGKILDKEKDAAGEYKDVVGRMKANEQSDMAENKKFGKSEVDPDTGEETNEFWKEELLAFSGETENFGRYNPQGRRNIAGSIEEIFNDEKKLSQFDSTQQKQLADMYEAATAKYKSNGERVEGEEGKGLVISKKDATGRDVAAVKDSTGATYIPKGMKDDPSFVVSHTRQRTVDEGRELPKEAKTPEAIPRVTAATGMNDAEIGRRRDRLGVFNWKRLPFNQRKLTIQRPVDEETGEKKTIMGTLRSPMGKVFLAPKVEPPKPVGSKEAFGLDNDELKKIMESDYLKADRTNAYTAKSYDRIQFSDTNLKNVLQVEIESAMMKKLPPSQKNPNGSLKGEYVTQAAEIAQEIIDNKLAEVRKQEWERDKQADTVAEIKFMEEKGRRVRKKPMGAAQSAVKKAYIKIKGGAEDFKTIKNTAGPQTGKNLRLVRKEIDRMRAKIVTYQKEMKRKGIDIDLDELKRMHQDVSSLKQTADKDAISADEFETIKAELKKVNDDLYTNRLVKSRGK